ncbi:hypothetical protein, partial [Staphylococcus simulans]|uniref:hypothetical protein n=1 Tax=Staphylococcus simulans TaxID=1286 RepID=UPI000FEE87B0
VRKLAALRAAIFSINIKKRRFSEIIMKIVAFIRSQNIYVPTPFLLMVIMFYCSLLWHSGHNP